MYNRVILINQPDWLLIRSIYGFATSDSAAVLQEVKGDSMCPVTGWQNQDPIPANIEISAFINVHDGELHL